MQKHLGFKQFLTNKIIRGRKPWSLATDLIFIGLFLMLLIPSTRSLLLSGVAAARTVLSNPAGRDGQDTPLAGESWNWSITDKEGRSGSFSSLRGEVIFLNQWATWCPPCRAELPSIERLYQQYGSRVKFVILTSEDPAKVLEYIEKHGYTFPVYFGSAGGSNLETRSIPATVIISRDGKIMVKKNGAFNWSARKIRKLIDGLLKQD